MLIIWADPRPYLATLFTAQMLSECGISVELVYRTPTPSLDVEGEINCGCETRLRPIGGGYTGWRDKFDYANYIVKLIALAWREKPDVIIGYNKFGLIASFIMSRFCSKLSETFKKLSIGAINTAARNNAITITMIITYNQNPVATIELIPS